MTRRFVRRCAVTSLCAFALGAAGAGSAAGDKERGARAFGACAACHSLEPGRHLTGPSLSGLWGRKAGTHGDFLRYSRALKDSGLVWNEQTLDRWLRNPEALVQGNFMQFGGVKDDRARADLLAFLKAASEPGGQYAGKRRDAAYVAVVAVDEQTLDEYKDDPLAFWQPHFARAMETLTRAGVKVIGLDYLYQVSAEDWLKIYAEHLEKHSGQIERNLAAWKSR